MPQKTIEIIIKSGVFLALASFFIIAGKLYFPYVTGKQFYFNIVIEIVLWFWLYLVVKFPATRPKISVVAWSLIAWLAVLLLSSIFGTDFNLSFWGDAERMLGWFSLAHFFAFYLILITVFKTKTDWQLLFGGFILSSVILSAYAFLTANGEKYQGNVNLMSNISTLGNATYVAGVMLFSLYFIAYLWLSTKNYQLKFWYFVSLIAVLGAFFYADVSGSITGLFISIFSAALIIGLLSQNKKVKIYSSLAVGLVVVAVVLAFAYRQAAVFDNNKVGRVLREFSTQSGSLGARTFAWRAGWQGFLERPILGFGWGNFAEPFDKYFQAGLYQLTPNEEFYDRAHNMVIEMLSTAGIFGLLFYLGLFAAVACSLVKAWRRKFITTPVLAVFSAMFIAYFIHNLAVFDSLANFVNLMAALGFVSWLTVSEIAAADNKAKVKINPGFIDLGLIIAALAVGGLIFYANVRPMQMFASTIKTAQFWYQGDLNNFFTSYDRTFSYQTPLDRDSRTMLANLVIATPVRLAQAPDDQVIKFFDQLLANSRKNLELNSHDYFFLTRQTALLELIGQASGHQDTLNQALAAADEAIANGGEHVPAFLYKTNILLALQRYPEAIAVLRQILAYHPGYSQIFCRLASLELRYGQADQSAFWSNFDDCLDQGKVGDLGRGEELRQAVKYYESTKDQVRLDKLKQQLIP